MLLTNLSEFKQQAEECLQRHRDAVTVDFDHNRYVVQVPSEDAPDGYWTSSLVFEQDTCSRAFCDCPDGDCCEHLMVAYLVAYDAPRLSLLHTKFQDSFWYHLFLHCFSEHASWNGDQSEGTFTLSTPWVTMKVSPQETFHGTVAHLFHEGATSCETFSASPFYALAKYLFLLCEQNALLHIDQNDQQIPLFFYIQDKHFAFRAEILEFSFLEQLFPKINFLRTSLLLSSPYTPTLESAYVDIPRAHICFNVCMQMPAEFYARKNIHIGNVIYIPSTWDSKPAVLLPVYTYSVPIQTCSILSPEIKQLLSEFCDLETYHQVRYSIYRSYDGAFSFTAYLECNGDLHNASLFPPHYCYIPPSKTLKGKLVMLQGLLAPELSFTVAASDVASFLDEHKEDMHEKEFQVFQTPPPFEALPQHHIAPNGVLFFNYTLGIRYDHWVYYPGSGFFPYEDPSGIRNIIPDGLNVQPQDIPQFIEEYRSTLEGFPGFFAPPPPLQNIVFHVHAVSHNKLELRPVFEGLENKECRLFGPYLYQEQGGFSLLPEHLQSLSSIPLSVEATDIPPFIAKYAQHEHIRFLDPEIQPPKTLSLNILSMSRPAAAVVYLELELQTDIGSILVKDLLKQLTNKRTFLFSKAGFLNFQLYFFRLLRSFITNKQYTKDHVLIVSVTDIYKLDVLAPLSLSEHVQASDEDLAFFHQIKNLSSPPLPHKLFSTHHNLRPYQSTGLLWLWFLYHHHLSGLLCDEMGLGKTHQAAALLDAAYQAAQQESKKAQFLVVCPASVLSHWEQVLTTHLPKNTALFTFHSTSKPDKFSPFDVMITSYGTLRRHLPLFSTQTFTIAIFDEVHIAKNKTSQIHKALRALDAHMKLGLTGTPIENNLFEFKNLIDIILPRYLPTDSEIKMMIAQQAQEENPQDPQHILFKMTKPFILKRTKKTVLPDLPEKVEATIHCALSSEQQSLYARTEHEYLTQQCVGTEEERALRYLALFCHLKQICDHPAVFLKQPDLYKKHASGKWDKFVELLQESLASGYKVVVFSQYIHMIHIITLYLKEQGIKYASIQGQTINRREEIESFTHDPECRVFVGSLLAAGTGINLTSGNVVILYDRWWNYAKESQALDRVHRIGQKQTVFIYKFITENTIEEKIQHLIEEKRQLLASTHTTDDEHIFPSLNAEDLRMILSYQDKLCNDALDP